MPVVERIRRPQKDRIKDIEVYDDNNAIFMSKIFEPYR